MTMPAESCLPLQQQFIFTVARRCPVFVHLVPQTTCRSSGLSRDILYSVSNIATNPISRSTVFAVFPQRQVFIAIPGVFWQVLPCIIESRSSRSGNGNWAVLLQCSTNRHIPFHILDRNFDFEFDLTTGEIFTDTNNNNNNNNI